MKKCGGVIDYDDGYNHLRCTKCGLIYRAKELEKAVENNKVMIKGGTYNMVVKITSGKGVQKIESNPERYLDVAPKLVARGNKKSKPVKISTEVKIKVTGLRHPKPGNDYNEETIDRNGDEDNLTFIACNGIVSNTNDLFGSEPPIKCILVKIDDDELRIGNDYVVIDKIGGVEVKNLSIVMKESIDQITDELDEVRDANSILEQRIEDLTKELLLRDKSISDYEDTIVDLESKMQDLKNKCDLYEGIENELEEERSAHAKTKSELLALDTVLNELGNLHDKQEMNDESASIMHQQVSFDVSSPMFTSNEDECIVETSDEIVPDEKDTTPEAQEPYYECISTPEDFEPKLDDTDKFQDDLLVPLPPITTTNYSSVNDYDGDLAETEFNRSLEDYRNRKNQEEPTENNNEEESISDDDNSSIQSDDEKEEQTSYKDDERVVQKINIPDEVKQQIKDASNSVSEKAKQTPNNNERNNYRWDARNNKKKHKKKR